MQQPPSPTPEAILVDLLHPTRPRARTPDWPTQPPRKRMFPPLPVPHLINRRLHLLEQRAHNARLRLNRTQHNRHIHDLLSVLLPAVVAGNGSQWLKRSIPIALAQLDVFKVEFAQRALMAQDEVCNLRRVHDGVFELHDAETRELEGPRSVGLAALRGVRVVGFLV